MADVNNNEEEKKEEQNPNQDANTEGNTDGGNGKEQNDHEERGEKTFTQSQVSRMMAKEKHQGANSVYNELGIDPKDTGTMKMLKAFIASQKSDEEKVLEQKNAQAAALAQAERKALVAEAKAEAMTAGVQTQFVDDVITLALAKIDNSSEDVELKTILGELKTKYPAWFGQFTDQGDGKDKKDKKKDVGQKGTGSSVKTSNASNKKDGDENLGARLAANRRKSAKTNKSFWSKN